MSGLSIDDTPPDGIETVYVPEEPYEPPKPAYAPLFNPTKFQEHPVPVLETATPSDIDGISMLIARCFAELDASRWLANNDEQWLNRRFWQFFRHVYARPALLAGRGLVSRFGGSSCRRRLRRRGERRRAGWT